MKMILEPLHALPINTRLIRPYYDAVFDASYVAIL